MQFLEPPRHIGRLLAERNGLLAIRPVEFDTQSREHLGEQWTFDIAQYRPGFPKELNEAMILRTAFGLFPFGGESSIFSGMTQDLPPIAVHPTGEQSMVALGGAAAAAPPLVVDSFAGSVRIEWDHATAFTPLGQLPFFIDFLKTAGLFADSPLNYESPNASKTRDVLGTAMLSMLAGH